MSRTTTGWTALLLGLAAAGCGGADGGPDAAGGGVAIDIAPLDLPGVGAANWRLTVTSALDEAVWTRDLDSASYGDGAGSVSYVGPCDASDGANPHSVSVELLALATDEGEPLLAGADFRDPGVISRAVACAADRDTPVDFEITLARRAEQGFFDVAVSFRSVFCSAKLDCVDALLHEPDEDRGPTVVMAFACTSGAGAPTLLYLSEIALACVDADPGDGDALAPLTEVLSPAAADADGNQGAAPPLLFQWARYTTREQLPGVDKCYWNHALGLDLAAIGARRCTLSARGTASDVALADGALPEGAVWPVITWEVDVVGADGALCGANPLDGAGSGVTTGYYASPGDGQPPLSFAAERACAGPLQNGPILAQGFTCAGADDAVFRATRDGDDAPAVAVTVDGVPAAGPYALPAGASLVDGCCLDACCAP